MKITITKIKTFIMFMFIMLYRKNLPRHQLTNPVLFWRNWAVYLRTVTVLQVVPQVTCGVTDTSWTEKLQKSQLWVTCREQMSLATTCTFSSYPILSVASPLHTLPLFIWPRQENWFIISFTSWMNRLISVRFSYFLFIYLYITF